MAQESFLDTNVIVNYAHYQKDRGDELIKRCYLYIVNKKGDFIVCYAVMRELSNIMTKLSVLHKEVLKKVYAETYSFSDSPHLAKRDVPFAEKLYVAYKETESNQLREIFASQRDVFEIEIERFLKNKVDSKVVPFEQIKTELVNTLRDVIENYADCQILASALQYQQGRDIFLFVTADKKDINPNNYDYLRDYGVLKKYTFPELHNLAFS